MTEKNYNYFIIEVKFLQKNKYKCINSDLEFAEMSGTMFDFFINFDEGVLNEIESASTDGKKPVQFFINRTLSSDASGNLALTKAVEDLPSFQKPKVEAETSQRVRKRELSPPKPRNTIAA